MKKWILALSMVAGIAKADCVCTMEWIWGGCAGWQCPSYLSDSASNGVNYDQLSLKNNCSRPINAAINFKDLDGNWKTNAWYSLQPGETKYVANSKNRVYYTYPQSVDHSELTRLTWTGNDFSSAVNGSSQVYRFRKNQFTAPNWTARTHHFNCPSVPRYKYIALAWNGNGGMSWAVRNSLETARMVSMNECNGTHGNCVDSGMPVHGTAMSCMAIAGNENGNRLYSWVSPTLSQAESTALSRCNAGAGNCRLRFTACNN